MNLIKNGLILVLIGLLFFIACKKEKPTKVRHEWIAQVDSFDLWASRVDHAFEYSKDFKKAKTITEDLLKNYIKHYFLDELYLLAEAKASGLDQLPEFKKILKKRKIEEMTKPNGPLFNSIIPDHFDVSEKQMQTLYQRLPYRLTLQQILATSKSLADSIFDALVKGADWDELVLKYSNDLYTANKQGVLSNYLTPGMAAPEYEEAAYSLWQVGQISQPVKTDFGYHIIRLMYREKLKVGSIEEEKARLEQIAQQAARTQFLRDYINSLFQKFHLTLNKNLYPALLKAFERKGIFGYVNPDKIDSEMMQQIFIKHDKDSLTLNDFVEDYNAMKKYDRYRLERPEDIEIMAKRIITKELMYYDGLERGLNKHPKYQDFVRYHFRHELVKIAQKKLIDEAIVINDGEVRDYFKRYRILWKNSKFEDVEPYVRNRLMLEKRKAYRSELLKALREKYPVKFNEAVIKELIEKYNKKKQAA
ncbi:MAG: peptidylprolyl isomerase [Caldisericaceae bacterium]|nr:peptidylprolyl isomerase [Caldisericaceae bacterium]